MFRTLLWTGMRLGEAGGVTWANVDLDGRLIRVRQTYSAVSGFGPTKTPTSRRDLYISDPALDALREQRGRQAEARLLRVPRGCTETSCSPGRRAIRSTRAWSAIGSTRS